MICTPEQACGQCGICIADDIDRIGASTEWVAKLVNDALNKRAQWMREQAAKQLEVLRLQLGSLSPTKANREIGSNLAVKNGAALIRALPLAPGGDDET